MNNIINFPVVSENDKQFLELEKQQKIIEEQRKRIEELSRKPKSVVVEEDDGYHD
jgi:hypothetical protein|tara:strand:- start:243 stop:407 length:165 start_codon:yes stop_codon:yes gene_type:complete